jgi:glycosyltransferase involved in cell wall biosynthesis
VRATVIVPTYDHGPLIEYAVGSALAQTEQDIEVLIVGDGVPDAARPAIEAVVASDERVRFLDRPKGTAHGFRHRDEAISEAKADKILYLADDDVWFPDHVAVLCDALESASFAASVPVNLDSDEARLKVPHDLAQPGWRVHLLDGRPMISLSVVGHTRELYARLERGWNLDASLYSVVWTEFANHAERMATIPRVTAVILPDTKRQDMSLEERAAELAEVAGLVSRPEGRLQLLERLLENEIRGWSEKTLKLERWHAQVRKMKKK